jgi:NADPH2:quinone reductase
MRALVCKEYGPPESLVIEEVDDPVAGAGQVLVDIAAAGINFPDVLSIAGQYQVKTPTPFIPGNEAAGTVLGVGDGVTRYTVGDRVIVNSRGVAFAEKCVADQDLTMPLPDGLEVRVGAAFTVTYGTAYHALVQSANLQPGETVLVLGAAGGVGIAAVEIAKTMGARVIAAASSDDKLEFAKASGADAVVNYSTQDLKETVKALTDGNGVDVVYDPVGGDLADAAFRALAWHGRYLVIGFASGDIPKFQANIALLKEASIVGVWWGTWAAKNPGQQIQNMRELADLIGKGALTPRVTESYRLEDYVQAFEAITSRRARGKVILCMR